MMIQTTAGIPLDAKMMNNYFRYLIDRFFKILPLKESEESSLNIYIRSLQMELLGCKNVMMTVQYDALFLSLICILQSLIDEPDCDVDVVRREVFRAISICNKLIKRYAVDGGV